MAAVQAGDRLELALGRGQPGEDRVGMADEGAARLRHAHPAGAALDERGARLALERRDLLGDRRLRVGERLGRRREGALRGDLAEDSEALDVEH